MSDPPADPHDLARRVGATEGAWLGVALAPGAGVGIAGPSGAVGLDHRDPARVVAEIERALRPRWVVWSAETATALVDADVRVARSWDVAAAHRLLIGGWKADAQRVVARSAGLDPDTAPSLGQRDLFSVDDEADEDVAIRADGHLNPAWGSGAWESAAARRSQWAELGLRIGNAQRTEIESLPMARRALVTAYAESATELLCAELAQDGLPLSLADAEAVIAGAVGARTVDPTDELRARSERDGQVLRHAPSGLTADLRNPASVRSLLRAVGVEVPDTRAARLEAHRDVHPLVAALLTWRKAERMATTYGYAWLDANVGADGRLRGAWTACDGAAGRMTASSGLHNMPTEMRPAVRADPGHVLVRADLGQIEPRMLAAVSGDQALATATRGADLYAPVAARLRVDRDTAKLAVLGAMYGQTTGLGADALRGLDAAYPVAMAYLRSASAAAEGCRDLRTFGGRLVRTSFGRDTPDERAARQLASARGRYGRNAMIQGAAAEFFKVWTALVRASLVPLGARIVLCLHDELLVHVPTTSAAEVAALVERHVDEAALRYVGDDSVRFVADVSIVERWSDVTG